MQKRKNKQKKKFPYFAFKLKITALHTKNFWKTNTPT